MDLINRRVDVDGRGKCCYQVEAFIVSGFSSSKKLVLYYLEFCSYSLYAEFWSMSLVMSVLNMSYENGMNIILTTC